MREQALVLFSGGQDSTTCLAWALANFARVETVGFRYGQRHAVELDCRPVVLAELRKRFPAWGRKLGEDHVLDLGVIASLGATAMTEDIEIKMTESGLPNTFVPGRNLLFFTVAAALAYRRGIRTLVGGMCETDFSGYPDCRDDTIKALQEELGGNPLVELILEHTHTCYLGSRERHEWGPGCGECPACKLRKDGHARYRAAHAARRSA